MRGSEGATLAPAAECAYGGQRGTALSSSPPYRAEGEICEGGAGELLLSPLLLRSNRSTGEETETERDQRAR